MKGTCDWGRTNNFVDCGYNLDLAALPARQGTTETLHGYEFCDVHADGIATDGLPPWWDAEMAKLNDDAMSTDRFGNVWRLSDGETCAECGQPDNCGDCNHLPLTRAEVIELGGTPPNIPTVSDLIAYLQAGFTGTEMVALDDEAANGLPAGDFIILDAFFADYYEDPEAFNT